jgi:hypothetical protein
MICLEAILTWMKEYKLFSIDFSNLSGTANNPMFGIRLRFDGDNLQADEGNRVTLNNISLEGTQIILHADKPLQNNTTLLVHPNPASGNNIYLPDLMNIQLYDIHGRIILSIG